MHHETKPQFMTALIASLREAIRAEPGMARSWSIAEGCKGTDAVVYVRARAVSRCRASADCGRVTGLLESRMHHPRKPGGFASDPQDNGPLQADCG